MLGTCLCRRWFCEHLTSCARARMLKISGVNEHEVTRKIPTPYDVRARAFGFPATQTRTEGVTAPPRASPPPALDFYQKSLERASKLNFLARLRRAAPWGG